MRKIQEEADAEMLMYMMPNGVAAVNLAQKIKESVYD